MMVMTKTVVSEERSTGMGATRFTAVLVDGKWHKVSSVKNARHLGRSNGVEKYAVEVANATITAYFYRSNSGIETVTASDGRQWESFSEASCAAAVVGSSACME
jgi:hypothetical protein